VKLALTRLIIDQTHRAVSLIPASNAEAWSVRLFAFSSRLSGSGRKYVARTYDFGAIRKRCERTQS
jgi:hypothetical protein